MLFTRLKVFFVAAAVSVVPILAGGSASAYLPWNCEIAPDLVLTPTDGVGEQRCQFSIICPANAATPCKWRLVAQVFGGYGNGTATATTVTGGIASCTRSAPAASCTSTNGTLITLPPNSSIGAGCDASGIAIESSFNCVAQVV